MAMGHHPEQCLPGRGEPWAMFVPLQGYVPSYPEQCLPGRVILPEQCLPEASTLGNVCPAQAMC